MTETLTDSFCERCGNRFSFGAPPKPRPFSRLRVLSRGLKTYVLTDESSLSDALSESRNEEERRKANHGLNAFHQTFNFCMSCRQYTCAACWNAEASRCLSCEPVDGTPAEVPSAAAMAPVETIGAAESPLAETPVAETLWDEPLEFVDLSARLEPAENGAGNGHREAAWTEPISTEPVSKVVEPPAEAPARPSAPAAQAAPAAPAQAVRPAVPADPAEFDALLARIELQLEAAEREARAKAEAERAAQAVAEAQAEAKITAQADADAELASSSEVHAEPAAPEAFLEATAEEAVIDQLATSEPEIVAAPELVVEPEALAVAEPEVVPAAIAEPVAEPTILAEAQPEVVEAEPEMVAEAVAEPEPVAQAMLVMEPDAVVEPAAVEAEPEIAAEAVTEPEMLVEPATAEPVAAVEPAAAEHMAAVEPEPVAATVDEPAPVQAQPEPTPPPARAPQTAPETQIPAAPPMVAAPPLSPEQIWWIVAPEGEPTPGVDRGVQPTWPAPTPQTSPAPKGPIWPTLPPTAAPSPAAHAHQPHVKVAASDAVWAASSRDVLNRPGSGVQACVSCGLALSAAARFCRRCGSAQG